MRKEEREFIDACRFGMIEKAAELLNTGVDMDIRDSEGWAPLHIVCLHGYAGIVRLLLDHGADVNARTATEHGNTPLHLACRYSGVSVVRLLMEHGADASAKNEEDKSPLDMIVGRLHYDPIREEVLGLFREFHPDLVMEQFCTMEVRP